MALKKISEMSREELTRLAVQFCVGTQMEPDWKPEQIEYDLETGETHLHGKR